MSGQTNKRLCGLISLEDVPLQPTMKLAAPLTEGKEIGWITSATHSQRMGKEIALGYVKRGFNSVGAKLDALVAADFATQKPNTIDRKSTRLNSSHRTISYAVFCLKKKKK